MFFVGWKRTALSVTPVSAPVCDFVTGPEYEPSDASGPESFATEPEDSPSRQ
ncbi:Uncharacterised protein [Mycobacteroides abscessus]|nr:Uncharacterised protein [Mycobacteroides abscessus]